MKTFTSGARLAALPLALATVFPTFSSFAQTQTTTQSGSISQLKEVVVTATRFAEPVSSLPLGVSVITAADIQASGVNSVNEAVMKLLGVPGRLDTSSGNNYTLDLRGFGVTADSNQVVIVDGLRLNEADLSSAGLASIPIGSVHSIEVLRGTGAVLYGEGATGGVIVVTTKAGTGAQRVNSAQLYAAVGSRDLQDFRAGAVVASGGFSLDVDAADRRSDGHRDNMASKTNSLNATGQWSNAWLRVGVRAGRTDSSSGLPGPLTAAQYEANPKQAKSLTEYGSKKNEHAGLFVEANVGNWQLAADTSQRNKSYSSLSFGSPYGYDVDANNTSLRARHEGRIGVNTNALVLGYDQGDWDRVITKSTFTPVGTRATAKTTAVYVKDDFTLAASGTRLSLGFRTEKLKKSEAQSATSVNNRQQAWDLGLSQAVAKNTTLYGRIGKSFRLPNVDEFSFTNPNVLLKPQTSRDVELGARFNTNASQLEVRWYRHNLKNEIGYDPSGVGPFGPFGANVNFDSTRRQGLELEARQSVNASLDLRLNAAWRQAKFTEGTYAGKNLALVPKKTLSLRADWRPSAGHSLNAGVNWVASQSPDFANACKMPSYTIADVRYAYQFNKQAEFALGVSNLSDHKYYTQAYGCTTAGVTTSIYPEAGRAVTASLRWKF